MADMENVSIFIEIFGGFDARVNGKVSYFPSSKVKEVLAITVEKRGSSISLSQVTYLLCESIEERTAKSNLGVVYYRPRMNLMEYGIGRILIKKRGSYAVDAKQFFHDFYEFIEGNPDCIALSSGSYISEYVWADDMLLYLRNLYRKYNGGLVWLELLIFMPIFFRELMTALGIGMRAGDC